MRRTGDFGGSPPDVTKEERERLETEHVIEETRDYVQASVPFLDNEKVRSLPSEQLIPLLQRYWNEPASFQHFRQMMTELGGLGEGAVFEDLDEKSLLADGAPLHEKYMDYLLNKLPVEVKEKQEDDYYGDDLPKKKAALEKIVNAASSKARGLNLGFHTSPTDLGGIFEGKTEIKPFSSNDIFTVTDPKTNNRMNIEDNTAKTWYSTNPRQLYIDSRKGAPNFIYLVEASRGDVDTWRYYAQDKQAFLNHSSLKVRCKIPLVGRGGEDIRRQVMQKLGLAFSEFGTI